MTFRNFLASLLAMALMTGAPAAVSAAATVEAAVSSPSDGGGCCGGPATLPTCFFVCPVQPAAVSAAGVEFQPQSYPVPLGPLTARESSVFGPPDTAPPKFLSV